MAALITKNYFQYGLSAKAYGPYIVYSGNANLGTVSNAFTGNGNAAPSFTTTTSAGAGTAAGAACADAPTAPAPASEVTIVGWIDFNAITLPSGESTHLSSVFPPNGVGGPIVNSALYALCVNQLSQLANGKLGDVSNTATDKAYANAWLLKFSGNDDPGPSITPSTFKSQLNSFRLFNDFTPAQTVSNTAVGQTLDPCGSGVGVGGEANSNDGKIGTSIFGDQYQLNEVRVGKTGQAGWATLNNSQAIPWVWSVIEFTPTGYPDLNRIHNNPLPLNNPTNPTTNYQIFPTYSVYINGKLLYVVHEGTPAAFSNLPLGASYSPAISSDEPPDER